MLFFVSAIILYHCDAVSWIYVLQDICGINLVKICYVGWKTNFSLSLS